jgi:hypothetical protein
MVKKDCFAYSKELERCSVLKDTYCRRGEKCNFYRTERERCKSCMEMKHKVMTCKDNIALNNCRRVVL